jgi:hypothetical protein
MLEDKILTTELNQKSITQLLDDLRINNIMLDSYIDSKGNTNSEIIFELTSKGLFICRQILKKPLEERKEYLLGKYRLFKEAVITERYELAENLRRNIRYFRHCFLEGIPVNLS